MVALAIGYHEKGVDLDLLIWKRLQDTYTAEKNKQGAERCLQILSPITEHTAATCPVDLWGQHGGQGAVAVQRHCV